MDSWVIRRATGSGTVRVSVSRTSKYVVFVIMMYSTGPRGTTSCIRGHRMTYGIIGGPETRGGMRRNMEASPVKESLRH